MQLLAFGFLFFLALLAFAGFILLIRLVKNLLVNTVFGLAALFIVNFLASLVLGTGEAFLPINFWSVLLTAALGLAGVGLLILLRLGGVVIA